jgi:NAD(P)H-quinone oxidoreductase subunit 5
MSLIGALTALVGSVVMLTQTSIKRSLAYSTIAQMGFMMLQCGLGAFSAALLHIVAHSLYKAHAFLSCGSVLDAANRLRTASGLATAKGVSFRLLPIALLTAVGLGVGSAWLWGIDLATKPGAAVLGLVLLMALTQLIWHALSTNSWRIAGQSIAAAGLVICLYLGAWLTIDRLLASSVSHQVVADSPLDLVVMGVAALGFIGVFTLQAAGTSLRFSPAVRALYVHAANGFYLDIPARRLTARIWGETAPTP